MHKYLLSTLLLAGFLYTQPKPILVMSLEKMTPYRANLAGNFQALRATISAAPIIYWNHPRLVVHTPYIIKRGFEIAPSVNGMDNLVHAISQEIDQKGWAQLSQAEKDAIVKIIVAPISPNFEVIEKMKELINRGHSFILATNQAISQHTFYKEIMNTKYGLNINKLCTAGTVTAPTYNDSQYNSAIPYYEAEPNWLVASDINPSESYCKALRELANRQEKNAPIYMVYTCKGGLSPEKTVLFQNYGITIFDSIDDLSKAIEKQ